MVPVALVDEDAVGDRVADSDAPTAVGDESVLERWQNDAEEHSTQWSLKSTHRSPSKNCLSRHRRHRSLSEDPQVEASTHPLTASMTNPSSHAVKKDAEQRAKVRDGVGARHTDTEKPRGTGNDARLGDRRSRGDVVSA